MPAAFLQNQLIIECQIDGSDTSYSFEVPRALKIVDYMLLPLNSIGGAELSAFVDYVNADGASGSNTIFSSESVAVGGTPVRPTASYNGAFQGYGGAAFMARDGATANIRITTNEATLLARVLFYCRTPVVGLTVA